MSSRHDHEIRPDDLWHLHLDAAHIGSGGDDSWSPSVHKVGLLLVATAVFGTAAVMLGLLTASERACSMQLADFGMLTCQAPPSSSSTLLRAASLTHLLLLTGVCREATGVQIRHQAGAATG